MDTYADDDGAERCDRCDEPAGECACVCAACGDGVTECACDEGPTY